MKVNANGQNESNKTRNFGAQFSWVTKIGSGAI